MTPTLTRIHAAFYDRSIWQDTHGLTLEGRLATKLIETWGMIAFGWEDAAGQTRMRLLTPAEVVERAFETAHLAIEAADERGLLLETLEEAPAERARRKAAEAAEGRAAVGEKA